MADIIVTGCETEPQKILKRILKYPYDLHEIRIDYLKNSNKNLWNLIDPSKYKLLITLREKSQGGFYNESILKKIAILEDALKAGVSLVDIELSIWEKIVASNLSKILVDNKNKIILSVHFSFFPENLSEITEKMDDANVFGGKIAIRVQNSHDIVKFKEIRLNTPKKIYIAMGEAGNYQRLRPSDFNSDFHYISSENSNSTAPGQLSVSQFNSFRGDKHSKLIPLVLFGAEQIKHSPGMKIYNKLFTQNDLPYQYISMIENRSDRVIPTMKALNISAASITMPHKEFMYRICTPFRFAKETNSVNTIILKDSDILGYNTDSEAFFEIFNGTSFGKRALILGSGSSARSAYVALKRHGISTYIATRNREKSTFFDKKNLITWDNRYKFEPQILINTTPLGLLHGDSPWDEELPDSLNLIIDLIISDEQTQLIAKGKAKNIPVISGLEFWAIQGKFQMEQLINHSFEIKDLRIDNQ